MKWKLTLAYLNTFTFSCVQMVLYITIPYITSKTGVQTSTIIGAISLGSLMFAFTGPLWAAQSDRLGRERVLCLGMFGMFLSFFCISMLFVFNSELPMGVKISLVFLGRAIYGLLVSAVVPVSQAWQLDLIPEGDRMKVLTKNSMFLNLGRILGPILVLVKGVQFEWIIYFATIFVLMLGIANISFIGITKKRKSHTLNESFRAYLIKWKLNFQESLYPILLAMIFTAFIGILHSFLGNHLKTVLGISGEAATLMFAKIILALSVMAIFFQQLGLFVFKSGYKPRILIGSISLVVGTLILMNSETEKMIWTSIVFISIATSLIPPVYLTLTSRSKYSIGSTNVFGKKLGLASIAHSVGYAVGAGLIALSLKLSLVGPSFIVTLISFSILLLSFLLIIQKENLYDRN